jgi:NitT/TauT family transport system permease protein
VGAIVGEGPGGIQNGLGRAILDYNQTYITGPERLWATILVTSLLGISFYLLVRGAETWYLRERAPAGAG